MFSLVAPDPRADAIMVRQARDLPAKLRVLDAMATRLGFLRGDADAAAQLLETYLGAAEQAAHVLDVETRIILGSV